MAIEKYNGEWSSFQAKHLLSRTTYGPGKQSIDKSVEMGLEKTVQTLLADITMPEPPVNPYFNNDPAVPIGETWINAPYQRINGLNNYRNRSLASWTIELAMEKTLSVREKMVLFWHNHFVTADVNDPRFIYQYINTIRTHAIGNIIQLTKEITIDPSMLRYLNGNLNTKNKPNENYARELLELFTVGKGQIAGPGDYTTFTEDDVINIAKVLTGWKIFGHNSVARPDFGSFFRSNQHDTSTKQLSERLGGTSIENANEEEYKILIDAIFTNRTPAIFLSRKLFRWFVNTTVSTEIEKNTIEGLADIMIENNYEVKPVLEALFTSKEFYNKSHCGCLIKHPLDYVLSTVNTFDILEADEPLADYQLQLGLFGAVQGLQMNLYNPPSVAGWKAFYQEPLYSNIWINSNTLPIRKLVIDAMTTEGVKLNRDSIIAIDVLKVVDNLENPYSINELLSDLAGIMYVYPLPEKTILDLKEILIPGLPDFEWDAEYGIYRNDPENEEKRKPVEDKLRLLFNYMMNLPEFQLY